MPRKKSDPQNLASIAATRQRLLDAAREEFSLQGYFSTDSNKIARRAGLSPGTFYNHFSNKLGIFCEVYEEATRSEGQQVTLACIACYQHSQSLEIVAAVFADMLVLTRKASLQLRMEGEILIQTEPSVLDCKMRVRDEMVEQISACAKAWNLPSPKAAELSMRLHVVNSLVDAIVSGEFDRYHVGNYLPRAEIVAQVMQCFRQPLSPGWL